ncbi:MAG: hypothetical protein LH645_03265 [Actinomycetia bacterium]|nr:hypothetical protein [Actinomycetes bacterium]
MLQGIPHAVETVGGFVVWDGGRAKLTAVGPALDLPGWLIGLSPFYHLALVPVADYALTRGW